MTSPGCARRIALLVAIVLAPGPGAAGSAVERPAEALVQEAASAAARAHVSAPDRFEVVSTRFEGADTVPDGSLSVEPIEVKGPTEAGIVTVRLRLLVDGIPRGESRAAVRGIVMGPALVARRNLAKGASIPADALERAEVDLTRLDEKPLRSTEDLGGLVPTRILGTGCVITPRLLAPPVAVRRGQSVDLTVEIGNLRVTARGTAKRDGAPGDTVPAERSTTRAIVLGVVQPDGSLKVLQRVSGGRRG